MLPILELWLVFVGFILGDSIFVLHCGRSIDLLDICFYIRRYNVCFRVVAIEYNFRTQRTRITTGGGNDGRGS
jgi:hypothetical protein